MSWSARGAHARIAQAQSTVAAGAGNGEA